MATSMMRVATRLGNATRTHWRHTVRFMASDEGLKKTVLHPRHVDLDAKMVPFAGYSMPVMYPEGIKNEHLFVRRSAGVFDVSHMGQVRIRGKDRVGFLERITTADVAGLKEGQAALSVITTKKGGIVDDTIITNLGNELNMVINGACRDKDMKHINEQLEKFKKEGKDVEVQLLDDRQLLAIQGPKAVEALKKFVKGNLDELNFMTAKFMDVLGAECLVSRCGYTGEDGFEVSIPNDNTREIFDSWIDLDTVKPIGLGARDSLRLEAGLCLYGNDIDEDITPVEANITFVIGKARRENGGFLGDDVILPQINDKSLTDRKRCGMVITGAPARGGERVFDEDTNMIGTITSGTFSPTMSQPIATGYLKKPHNQQGTKVLVNVRGKMHKAETVKMPFTQSNYYRGPDAK